MPAQTFGLDIGRSFIKVVEVKKRGSVNSLTAAASVLTPAGGLSTESPLELKKIADAIKNCIKSTDISTNRCAVSLVESQVLTRLITMPNLTDKELSAAINYEADRYVPYPIKEVNLQYQVVTRRGAQDGNNMDILLVAAPKRVSEKYIKVVKDAGLEVAALETEATSLSRALFGSTDPPTIILSMGAFSVDMVMVKAGYAIFTRSLATGGVNLTKAIMAEFNLSENQAEAYKHAYGIVLDKLEGKVANIIKPILEVLVNEILRAIDYSKTHMENYQVTRLIICGGGAYLPGLGGYLTERTSLEVSLADPWVNFTKDGLIQKIPGQGAFYAVATGLALRS